jgi:hypothetical protein
MQLQCSLHLLILLEVEMHDGQQSLKRLNDGLKRQRDRHERSRAHIDQDSHAAALLEIAIHQPVRHSQEVYRAESIASSPRAWPQ